MKMWMVGLTLVGILAGTTPLMADKKAKPKGELGSEWVNAQGNSRHAQVGLRLESERGLVPGIYRPVRFDWRVADLQKGKYPGDIDKDQEGKVGLRLTIGADGSVMDCKVTKPDAIAAFNQHACPHILRHGRFVPALSDQGERLAKSFDAVARYELVPVVMMMGPPGKYEAPKVRRAQFVVQPTLTTAGIGVETPRPANVRYVGAVIGVGTEGQVTGCTLHSATDDDVLDRQICDSFKKNLVIRPAIDIQTNQPIEDSITVSLYWDK
jgi:hypothetical protein